MNHFFGLKLQLISSLIPGTLSLKISSETNCSFSNEQTRKFLSIVNARIQRSSSNSTDIQVSCTFMRWYHFQWKTFLNYSLTRIAIDFLYLILFAHSSGRWFFLYSCGSPKRDTGTGIRFLQFYSHTTTRLKTYHEHRAQIMWAKLWDVSAATIALWLLQQIFILLYIRVALVPAL